MPKENVLSPTERVRLNLEIARPVHEQMQALQARSQATSLTEVIRRALALYDLVTEHITNGGEIILKTRKGGEEKLRIL
jgi:hypothetical protein